MALWMVVVSSSTMAPAQEFGPVPGAPEEIPVEDVIAARQALMAAIEELMQPVDTYTVDDTVDPDRVRTSASAISSMLLAVPQLFPATTNRYDPDDEYPVTLALPAVWERFAAFYAMASAASDAALELAGTTDADGLRKASLSLRASCDACHAVYLLPYEPAGVTQEDRDFDFDSIFGN